MLPLTPPPPLSSRCYRPSILFPRRHRPFRLSSSCTTAATHSPLPATPPIRFFRTRFSYEILAPFAQHTAEDVEAGVVEAAGLSYDGDI
jgi:CubicO group peptidase (beta-lactamase class C family)